MYEIVSKHENGGKMFCWRKSLIFQLLVILEQAKGLKQGGGGFTGSLEI